MAEKLEAPMVAVDRALIRYRNGTTDRPGAPSQPQLEGRRAIAQGQRHRQQTVHNTPAVLEHAATTHYTLLGLPRIDFRGQRPRASCKKSLSKKDHPHLQCSTRPSSPRAAPRSGSLLTNAPLPGAGHWSQHPVTCLAASGAGALPLLCCVDPRLDALSLRS